MILKEISPGKSFPDDFNAIIEISADAPHIKYEIDKKGGILTLDRFLGTSMVYPANYGFVPNTLSGDGDPCDVLVISPYVIPPGVLVRVRALGLLDMEDDSGIDKKIIAVPITKICPLYKDIHTLKDLPHFLLHQIRHFFEHYKDLEEGKWVKIGDYHDADAAAQELKEGVERFKQQL
ncbi:MAG: inorganic diphosphatase [Haemophilus parainfluenzae]|jgi:inorganic diphosphatase|nr:MAG: inorganic diphosphatase [Haemophilus parainfluenzae]